jgi:hypothetical protein
MSASLIHLSLAASAQTARENTARAALAERRVGHLRTVARARRLSAAETDDPSPARLTPPNDHYSELPNRRATSTQPTSTPKDI